MYKNLIVLFIVLFTLCLFKMLKKREFFHNIAKHFHKLMYRNQEEYWPVITFYPGGSWSSSDPKFTVTDLTCNKYTVKKHPWLILPCSNITKIYPRTCVDNPIASMDKKVGFRWEETNGTLATGTECCMVIESEALVHNPSTVCFEIVNGQPMTKENIKSKLPPLKGSADWTIKIDNSFDYLGHKLNSITIVPEKNP